MCIRDSYQGCQLRQLSQRSSVRKLDQRFDRIFQHVYRARVYVLHECTADANLSGGHAYHDFCRFPPEDIEPRCMAAGQQ